MPFVSVTRLHLTSKWHLPAFLFHSLRSISQARQTRGYLGGWTGNDDESSYWTATVWESVEAMRAFRNTGAHLKAMPKLLRWCDEASFAHFEQSGTSAPNPDAAYEHLRHDGRLSKVHAPSARHAAGETVGTAKTRSPQRWTPKPPA